MKRLLSLLLMSVLTLEIIHAQSLDWIGQFSTENGVSIIDMALDADGNIYTCGNFGGTVDLDPGPAVFEVTGSSFVAKLDSDGNLLWAEAFESIAISTIGADDSGNVYVGFNHFGTADFDPGEGVLNFTAQGFGDIVLLKLSSTGELEWAHRLGGSNTDNIYGLHIEGDGTIYATGTYRGNVDFDPSPESAVLNEIGGADIYILKLNTSGEYIWAKQLGGSGFDYSNDILVDDLGDVYIQGEFSASTDFDPGEGSFPLVPVGDSDIFLCKLNASGDFQWAGSFGGQASASPTSMTSYAGHVYLGGLFIGTADLDPGTEVLEVQAPAFQDAYLCKIASSTGALVWARSFECTNNAGFIKIAVDNSGDVFSASAFSGTIDLDPGTSQQLVQGQSPVDTDIFISRLDSDGNYICGVGVVAAASQVVSELFSPATGKLIVSGIFEGTVDFDPGSGVSELVQVGEPSALSDNESDVFIMQLDLSTCQGVNIEEQSAKSLISIFPNPTSGNLNIDLGEMHSELEVRLMDLTGQLISTEMQQNTNFISLDLNVPAGVYFLEVLSNENRTVFRVIRE